MPRLLAPLALAILVPVLAFAAWQPGGSRISPEPADAFDSFGLIGSAADGHGGATIGWVHQTYDPIAEHWAMRVAAQHVDLDAAVVPGWPAGERVVTSWDLASAVGVFGVAPLGLWRDGVGGAYVATLEHALLGDYIDYLQVYRLRLTGAVGPLGAPPYGLLPATHAAVDADGASGLVMVAKERTYAPPPGPPPPAHLFAQRVDSTGTLLWPGTPLVPPGQDAPQHGLAALGDGAGGGFLAWVDVREAPGGTPDPDLYLQHLDATATIAPGWPAGGVPVCGAGGLSSQPRLASDGAGGAFVAWIDDRTGVNRVRLACVRSDGTLAAGCPVDGRLIGGSGAFDALLDLAADGAGGVYLARADAIDPSTQHTQLHRLAADGLPMPGWPLDGIALDAAATSNPGACLLAAVGSSVYAGFRAGDLGDPAFGLYATHMLASGSAPGWVAGGERMSGTHAALGPLAICASNDGAIVAWDDVRGASSAVYAQRLLLDGPVSVALALVSAEAEPGRVRLRWAAPDAARPFSLERREEATPWSPLADLTPDATGLIEYADTDVSAGGRYGYRLRWTDAGGARVAGEAWVSVPGLPGLTLAAPPSPVSRSSELRFTVPRAMPVRLTIHDASGRRVRVLESGTVEAGEQVRRWDLDDEAGRPVGGGLYFVRLEAAGRSLTRRVVALK